MNIVVPSVQVQTMHSFATSGTAEGVFVAFHELVQLVVGDDRVNGITYDIMRKEVVPSKNIQIVEVVEEAAVVENTIIRKMADQDVNMVECKQAFESTFAVPVWMHQYTYSLAWFPEQSESIAFLQLSLVLLKAMHAKIALSVITNLAHIPTQSKVKDSTKASKLMEVLYEDVCLVSFPVSLKAKFDSLESELDLQTRIAQCVDILNRDVSINKPVVQEYMLFITQAFIYTCKPYPEQFESSTYAVVQEQQSLPDRQCSMFANKRVPHSTNVACMNKTKNIVLMHSMTGLPLPTKEEDTEGPVCTHIHTRLLNTPALMSNTVYAVFIYASIQYILAQPLTENHIPLLLLYKQLERVPKLVISSWLAFFYTSISLIKTITSKQLLPSIKPALIDAACQDKEYHGRCVFCKQHYHLPSMCPALKIVLLRQLLQNLMQLPPTATFLLPTAVKGYTGKVFTLLQEFLTLVSRGIAVSVCQMQPFQIQKKEILCSTDALSVANFVGCYKEGEYTHTDMGMYIDATEDVWPVLRQPLHFVQPVEPVVLTYPPIPYDEDVILTVQLSFTKILQHYMNQTPQLEESVFLSHLQVLEPFSRDKRVSMLTRATPANEAMQVQSPIMDQLPASPVECAMGYVQLMFKEYCTDGDIALLHTAVMQFLLTPFIKEQRYTAFESKTSMDVSEDHGLAFPSTSLAGSLQQQPEDLLRVLDIAPFSTVMRGTPPNMTQSKSIPLEKQQAQQYGSSLLPLLTSPSVSMIESLLVWMEEFTWTSTTAFQFVQSVVLVDNIMSKKQKNNTVDQWSTALDIMLVRFSNIFSAQQFLQTTSIHQQYSIVTILAILLVTRAKTFPDPEITDADQQPLGMFASHPATQVLTTGIQQCLTSASQASRVQGYVIGQLILAACDPYSTQDVFGRPRSEKQSRYHISPFKASEVDRNPSIPMTQAVSSAPHDIQLTDQWLRSMDVADDTSAFIPKANPKAVVWPHGIIDTVYMSENANKKKVTPQTIVPKKSSSSTSNNTMLPLNTNPTDDNGVLIPQPLSLQDCILQLSSSSAAEIVVAQSFVPQIVTSTLISSYQSEAMLTSIFQSSWSSVHSKNVRVTTEFLQLRSKACITCIIVAPIIIMPVVAELLTSHSCSIEDRHTLLDYITTSAVSLSRQGLVPSKDSTTSMQPNLTTLNNIPRHTQVNMMELTAMFPEYKDTLRAMKFEATSTSFKSSQSKIKTTQNRFSTVAYKYFLLPLLLVVDMRPEILHTNTIQGVNMKSSHRNLLTTDTGLFSRFLLTVSVFNEVIGPIPEIHSYIQDIYMLWCRVRDHHDKSVRLAATLMIFTLCRDTSPTTLEEHIPQLKQVQQHISARMTTEPDEEVQIYYVHILQLLSTLVQ